MRIAVLFVAVFSLALQAAEADIISPSDLGMSAGSATGNLLFSERPHLVQTYYSSSQLSGISIGEQILGMQLRADADSVQHPPTELSFSDLKITLFTTTVAAGDLNTTFPTWAQTNIDSGNGDDLLVFDGPRTIAMSSYPGGPIEPNPFGPEIRFSTPFTYNGGALVVQFSHGGNGGANSLSYDAASRGQVSSDIRTLHQSPPIASVVSMDVAAVLQFVTVPEPSAAMLLTFATVAGSSLCWVRCRYRA